MSTTRVQGELVQEHSESHLDVNPTSQVKLIVGSEEALFVVPEDLICSRCPFFLNAFQGNFLESKTKVLTFQDDDPERFHELSAWLSSDSLSDVNPEPSWLWLARLWIFADKYHIDDLQNAIMDVLYSKFAAHEDGINISFETLDYVVENTSPRSPLRRMFTDLLTNGISLRQLPARVDNIPPDFLQDMCIALKLTVSANGPTNTSLLTDPISTYYSSSSFSKRNAMPKQQDPSDAPTEIYCNGPACWEKDSHVPIRGTLHMCTNHNIKLCTGCRHTHNGHRKKMISLTTAPYKDFITGNSTVIDGYINDSGFYCNGPKCDPENKERTHQIWSIMSGDRYHCLECHNKDYCSLCIRGSLKCKEEGHALLRIRPTHVKPVPLTESITIRQKQERLERGVCWRCESDEHGTEHCEAKEALVAEDVAVED